MRSLKSYEDLSLFCFGKKVRVLLDSRIRMKSLLECSLSACYVYLLLLMQAAIFVEMNILVFCFGIAVAYLVTLGDILTPLGELYFGTQSMLAQRWVLMTISCVTIMLPLSLLKDISSLQFSSILGVLSIFFLVIAVCIRSIMHASANGLPEGISWTINLTHGPNFMLSVPIVMFAFTCQVSRYM